MKRKIFVLLMSLLLIMVFPARNVKAEDEIIIYVVPAITDEKILPTTSIPESYVSNRISVVVSPGEFQPASFVVRALDDIVGLQVVPTELSAGTDSILSDYIDIRVVKCWYQAGTGRDVWGDVDGKHLTPELLLKDDSLVKIDSEENYVWNEATNNYTWISERKPVSLYSIPFNKLSIRDSQSLKPVDVTANTNKQFWVTFKVLEGQAPGLYTGKIKLSTAAGPVSELQVQLKVLPINLAKPFLTYSLYYASAIDSDEPGVSRYNKTETEFKAELINMFEHGVTNPTLTEQRDDVYFAKALGIRQELGLNNQPLYRVTALYDEPPPSTPADLANLETQSSHLLQIARSFGISDVYFYGIDEARTNMLAAQIPAFQAIHKAGGKIFASGWKDMVVDNTGDLIDVGVISGEPTLAEAAKWHSLGHSVFNYANPMAGLEAPGTQRRNYGLLLWQKDYDGAMNFAYQGFGLDSPWNDFDSSSPDRDSNLTYPTASGLIDTIQWEGFREGVDDIRYLTTLLKAIETAKAKGRDVSTAETWLADLKNADLAAIKNLDIVRSEMVDYILDLTSTNFLKVSSSTGGSVTDPGEGTFWYDAGTLVPLRAQANVGYNFLNWAGNTLTIADINSPSTTVNMSSDYAITANFAVDSGEPSAGGHPAKFTVSNLAITPDSVKPGEEVVISALITNTGDLTGSFGVTLRINSSVVATKEITLAGGEYQTVSFSRTPNGAGTHTVDIGGLTGTFEVIPVKANNWWLIIGTTAGIIIIVLLIYRAAIKKGVIKRAAK